MKTPTLIVRLVGLYLLIKCSIGLLQLKRAQAMVGLVGSSSMPLVEDFRLFLWLGLALGLVSTLFAGPFARILTVDAGWTVHHPEE